MKKLLPLSFAALFVVASSSLSFAQPVMGVEVETDEAVVVEQGHVQADCCPAYDPPARPFFRSRFAAACYNPCCNPCPEPCPTVCPTACPRPMAFPRPTAYPRPMAYPCPTVAPQCDPCYDPCVYPAYGYRTPVRNFLGRVFAPRYYDYGCPPVYYGP